jgi:hypothetical protein
MITNETKAKLYELVDYYINGKVQEFHNTSYSSITFKNNRFQELQKEHSDLMNMVDSIE